MPLFDIPVRAGKAETSKLAKKSKTVKKGTASRSMGLSDRISSIVALCESKLEKYKDNYALIQNEQELEAYITTAIENGIISIDTETTGLDPMQDKCAGLCLYTPSRMAVYVPVNHISYITGARLEGQLTEAQCKKQIQRLVDNSVKVIMFNADFDLRVIGNQIGVKLNCYFDCYLAARCLNENEPVNNLKSLHNKYCLAGEGDAWTFGDLFSGVSFINVPLKAAYLYAARDAEITYELYEYQFPFLEVSNNKCIQHELQGVSNVFWNIEMPCVEVVATMEDNGILFDFDKQKELSEKYEKMLENSKADCYSLLDEYFEEINAYKKAHSMHKLDNPINLSSPTQLSILLYDILKIEPPDSKTPRGTGEHILSKIDLPLCNAILKYRELDKLISTYINKLGNCVNPTDGRIHCKFNQYGADTGRFSSSDPNLQNIPSHNKDIRQMFKASEGYVLMSSDFSQQEPKALAAMCAKAGDSQLLETFKAGKDLYSEIASVSFGYKYEECKEFNSDGTTNKEGKERRTQAKSILLGILYGRGIDSIAEQLHCSKEKAQSIKDKVFNGFPAIKDFEADSIDMAERLGYVDTVCGRKRRLPDMQLDEFEFKYSDEYRIKTTDILGFEEETVIEDVPTTVTQKYIRQLRGANRYNKRQIIDRAAKEGIIIKDNGGFIAQATRQCVNSRIQGSAADLTKLAMIKLHNNQELKELGFRMLIPVHDEIIAECPKENAKECSKLLADTMSQAAESILGMPISCDVVLTNCWYGDEIFI